MQIENTSESVEDTYSSDDGNNTDQNEEDDLSDTEDNQIERKHFD